MTKSVMVKDAEIVDVLTRFQDGRIDLSQAALELMKLKERTGLPIDDGLMSYIGNSDIHLHNVQISSESYNVSKLTVQFYLHCNHVDMKREVFFRDWIL